MIVEQKTTYMKREKRERIEPRGDQGDLSLFYCSIKPNQGGT